MTKNEFLRRVHQRESVRSIYRMDEIETILHAILDEIKDTIRSGDEIHLNNFGRIYPKDMQPREVKGGWYKDTNTRYQVPAKRKIGLSSFPTVDRYVSKPLTKDEKQKRYETTNDDDSLFNS